MLTLDRRATPLALCERSTIQPTLLGGLLFAALEIVPLSAEGPITAARAAGIAGLLAASVGLLLHGLPRSRRRSLPAGVPTQLELGGEALPPTYRATLVLADGSRHRVLERDEPAGLLEDAAHLA